MVNEKYSEVKCVTNEGLFEMEVECTVCGANQIMILFDEINKRVIFKCSNKNCNVEDYINLY